MVLNTCKGFSNIGLVDWKDAPTLHSHGDARRWLDEAIAVPQTYEAVVLTTTPSWQHKRGL